MSVIDIGNRLVGTGHPAYFVAELSANHQHSYARAVAVIEAAKAAGADAIKLQTYTADSLTLDCDLPCFQIRSGPWAGRTLYELYRDAYTPWDWHRELKATAQELGLAFFSTPFDHEAVDLLRRLDVPAFKIASFENGDLPLLRYVAATRKPIILSTGLATLAELDESVAAIRDAGNPQIALLKCTSEYPASADQMNLRSIPFLAERYETVVGLSDHTLDIAVPVAAVTLGAAIIEKHLTLSRSDGGPDAAFSLEPEEFRRMVLAVRAAEASLGSPGFHSGSETSENRRFRRSLFVTRDMTAGELFTHANVRSIRPSDGLHPRYLDLVVGRASTRSIARGTPLSWDCVEGGTGLINTAGRPCRGGTA